MEKKEVISNEEPLVLPTEFFKPKLEGIPKKLGMVVFGAAKVGKTTFASEFPNSLIIECEQNGADYLKCKKIDVKSLKEIREIYKLLKDDDKFETVIIDSLDKIASLLEEEVCQEIGISNIMESKKGEKHGTQWILYKEKVLSFVQTFLNLDKKVIFLSHTKKTETDGFGTILNPKTINLYGSTAIDLLALVDNIGYMFCNKVEGKVRHFLSFEGGLNVEAGGRHPALSGKIIELPKGKGYEAFASLFEMKKIKKDKI
jgi:hypothetical protein